MMGKGDLVAVSLKPNTTRNHPEVFFNDKRGKSYYAHFNETIVLEFQDGVIFSPQTNLPSQR
jgi:hypothetical protein